MDAIDVQVAILRAVEHVAAGAVGCVEASCGTTFDSQLPGVIGAAADDGGDVGVAGRSGQLHRGGP